MARRYILVKIVCDRKPTNEQFHEILDNSVKRYFGELGASRIDPRVVKFDVECSTAIVSCERSATSELQTALTLTRGDAESSMSFLVLHISGTVKGAAKGIR